MRENPYARLRGQVERLCGSIGGRRAADLACQRGCSACCHVQLTLTPLEALEVRRGLAAMPVPARERVRVRARELLEARVEVEARVDTSATPSTSEDGACCMLETDGTCALYEHRPLVCRTQGHALRYPPGTLPEEAIFAQADGAAITWCPLNYVERPPKSEDVFEASRIDERLGQACLELGLDPLARVSMADLGAEAPAEA